MNSGAPVWLTMLVLSVVAVATAVPKILGPIGTALDEWGRRRRAAREEQEAATLAETNSRIRHLESRIKQLKAELVEWEERDARWDIEWRVHRHWDYQAQEALLGRKPPFDTAPPFKTPDPPLPAAPNTKEDPQ